MKRKRRIEIISLLLMITVIFVGCGNSNYNETAVEDTASTRVSGIDKNEASAYIGDWTYDTKKGNIITFHINKGGIGSYEQSTKKDTKWDFSYEIKDGVIVMTRNAIGTTFLSSYELSDDGKTLSYLSGDFPQGEYQKLK